MKSTTKNRIIGIVLVAAMSAGLIISGLSVLLAQTGTDEKQAESKTSAGNDNDNNNENAEELSGTDSRNETAKAESRARESVTGFFSSIRDGKIQEAFSYTEEQAVDPFGIKERENRLNASTGSEPEEIREILDDYFRFSSSQYVREYAIEDSVQQGDAASFLVEVTSADYSKQVQRDEEPYNQQVQDYLSSHLDELNEIAATQSQEAADNHLKAVKMKSYYSDTKEDVRNLPDRKTRLEVVAKKQSDGGYKIESITTAG